MVLLTLTVLLANIVIYLQAAIDYRLIARYSAPYMIQTVVFMKHYHDAITWISLMEVWLVLYFYH